MSEIEDLLRKHTASVDETLTGFEGQITTLSDAVKALIEERETLGSTIIPAASRGGTIVMPATIAKPEQRFFRSGFQTLAERRTSQIQNLSISNDERSEIGDIMRGVATAAMRESSDPDGGFLVPEVVRDQIEALVLRQSPVRRVARILDFTSTARVILPVNTRGAEAGWVGEGEDRAETDTPELAGVTPPGGTLYALPKASEEVVDDAIINLEQFLEENVVDAFAETESEAFIRGNGVKKPAGFLHGAPTSDPDSTRALGTLQYIATDDAGTIGANPLALLVSMVFSMKAGYRQAPGVAWLASTDLLSQFARLQDDENRPVYVPSLQDGVPGRMLGYPVIEAEHMDSVAANAFPLAFGNWQRGYAIGDRTQLNILRDPYTTKGQIKWYFRKRVHGSVLNSEAIKVAKVAAA